MWRVGKQIVPWRSVSEFAAQAENSADQLRPVGMVLRERLEFVDEVVEDSGPRF
jgi:hypothetical protein